MAGWGEYLRSWIRKRDEDIPPSSNAGPPRVSPLDRNPLTKLNDHVYEIFNPSGRPSIEIVFFHGLRLGGSEKHYISTWMSRDGSELWLKWIVDAYPAARVIVISYDASVKFTEDEGLTDMYITRENLVQDLTTGVASIGQDGCPVILVGHCMGGLVLKQVCVQANLLVSLGSHKAAQNLLNNIKGLFFYGSPHHGSQLADTSTRDSKGLLFQDLTTLNSEASRRNEEFRQLRKKFAWKAYGIGESLPVSMQGFRGLVVAEASARHDVDSFYTASGDHHFNVCRPASTKSSSFSMLSNFVADVLKEDEAGAGHKIDFVDEVVGLDQPIKNLVERLKGETRLGIVGMGGLGKTTLAKALFNFISGNFEYTCFMEDVKSKVASEVHPTELRRKITSYLYHKGKKVNEKVFKWSDLHKKKVLIVLDDVNSESQVAIMTKLDGFANESRIIVTSRDKRVLEQEDFNIHFPELLQDEDSRKLFCQHAFKTAMAPCGYEKRVENFAKKCGGLPLALRVGGKYLYNRKQGELWEDALEKLSKAESLSGIKNDPLWSILEVTYNSLAESEQEMFLDIAACFHGEPLMNVQNVWRVCNWASANSGWVNLLDKGLVTESDFCIQMHEILRDWGRKRAGQSRVFLRLSSKPQKWPFDFDEANTEVKVLKIVCHTGDTPADKIDFWLLQHALLRGFGKSNYFSLEANEDCIGVEDVKRFGDQLKAVTHLEFRNCAVIYLPESFGQLKELSRLIFLNTGLRSLPECFGQLKALSYLGIFGCVDLRELPEGFGQLTALNRLEIESCTNLQILSENFGQLKVLSYLLIRGCDNLRQLPESFGQLAALSHLKIQSCETLQSLPESFGQLTALNRLDIESCTNLQILSENFGQLKALRSLDIAGCDNLQNLPEYFGQLTALKHLTCGSRRVLQSFYESLPDLKALSFLHILGCDKLQKLPESFCQLTALSRLVIENCEMFQGLPENLGQFKALRTLIIRDCEKLQKLPESFCQLTALSYLEIGTCEMFQGLPETLGQFKALRALIIRDCKKLQKLPESFCQLTALSYLEIDNCEMLQGLPESFGQFKALSHLTIRGCAKLQTLPESFGQLTALEFLEIRGCKDMRAFPESVQQLKCLRKLILPERLSMASKAFSPEVQQYCQFADDWSRLEYSDESDFSDDSSKLEYSDESDLEENSGSGEETN